MKKSGAKVGLAVAAGYYLGRRRKLRLAGALALAGVAGLRRKSKLLDKGIKALGSPELEELAERLRTDLRDVGRTAVTVATNRPINALSDVIHDRAEALRHPE
ncbi:MAG: DNA primase, partial [Actinomycetes bacterium]